MKAYEGKGTPKMFTLEADDESKCEDTPRIVYRLKERTVQEQPEGGWKVGDWEQIDTFEFDLMDLPGMTEEIWEQIAGTNVARFLRAGRVLAFESRTSQTVVGPEKFEAFEKYAEIYRKGEWKAERTARYRIDSILVDALCDLKPGVSRASIEATLKDQQVDVTEFLAKAPQVKVIYDKLKAEAKSADPVDFSDLMS